MSQVGTCIIVPVVPVPPPVVIKDWNRDSGIYNGRLLRQVRTCIILTLDPCDFDTVPDPRIRTSD
jgi:hypothetical protein